MFTPFAFIKTTVTGGGGFDPDATTYINAVISAGGTLTSEQQTSIDTFFVTLKSQGIYNKLYYMHPFLGGVANSNKINAINPGTYDIIFNGSWTHSTTGSFAAAQNTSTYGDTGYDINTSTAANNWTFGYIHKPTKDGEPAGYSGTGPGANFMLAGWAGGTNVDAYYPSNAIVIGAVPAGGGLIGVVRSASNVWKAMGKASGSNASAGPSYSSNQTSTWSPPGTTTNIYYNKVNPDGFPSKGLYTYGFAAQSLSNTELTDLVVNINNLQVSIGNNIFVP